MQRTVGVLFGVWLLVQTAQANLYNAKPCYEQLCAQEMGFIEVSSDYFFKGALYEWTIRKTFYPTEQRHTVMVHVTNLNKFNSNYFAMVMGNGYQYHVTSGEDHFFYLRDVKELKVYFASNEDEANFKLYFFFDCNLITGTNVTLDHNEEPPLSDYHEYRPAGTYEMQDYWAYNIFSFEITEEDTNQCWFLLPQAGTKGEIGDKTFLLVDGVSVEASNSVHVIDAIAQKPIALLTDASPWSDIFGFKTEKMAKFVSLNQRSNISSLIFVYTPTAENATFNIQTKLQPKADVECVQKEKICRLKSAFGRDPSIDCSEFKPRSGNYSITTKSECRVLEEVIEEVTRFGSMEGARTLSYARSLCSDIELYCSSTIHICSLISATTDCQSHCLLLHIQDMCYDYNIGK